MRGMSYRLSMETMTGDAVETFTRDFATLEEAKSYAEAQANSGVFWTVREGYWDGLTPGYAFRIEELQEE